jgi:6-phosphofructokinase 1
MTKQRKTVKRRKRSTSAQQAAPAGGPAFKRVCILTGGGDAPGLNAVLRAFVKTCEPLGIEVWGSEDGFEGLIQPGRLVHLTRASVRGILPKGGSILGCSNRANPFAYPLKDRRGRETAVDVSDDVIGRVRKHQIDALVLVGGDGTMHHAAAFMERGLAVIGVPKTIDNDLFGSDYSFGFDTALSTATWAIDALHATAESHDRIMIVEVMGRYAGWIALGSGVAGGADVILMPEIPYEIDRVVAKLRTRSEQGSKFSIVVVGEGALPKGGARSTVARARKGQLERLGGAGQLLASQLHERIDHDIRVTVLGHLQRGGSPTAFDRLLGTRFGVRAARCCERGEIGVMVALQGQQIVTIPIAETMRSPKRVDPAGDLAQAARSIGIELGG